MAKVTLTIQTQTIQAPLGTNPGPFMFRLTPKAGGTAMDLQSDQLSVTFDPVPAADYSTSAWRIDATTGQTIGDVVTGRDIAVGEFTSNVDVPASITVVLGA
jgi:hypothetical protein